MELLKYLGISLFTTASAIWGLYEFYFKENLRGQINTRVQKKIDEHYLSLEGNIREQIEKKINKHYLSIGHYYNRQITDYNVYVHKKHKSYLELLEKIVLIQALLHNQDSTQKPFQSIGLNKIKEYNDKQTIVNFEKTIENWSIAPEDKKDKEYKKIMDATKLIQFLTLTQVIPEMHRYFYMNKIYFSKTLCEKIDYLIEEFNSAQELIFVNKMDSEKIMKNINSKIDEIIILMRKELSAEVTPTSPSQT